MKTLTYDKFEEHLPSSMNMLPMGVFKRGAARATAYFHNDTLIVYPSTWELTGRAHPTTRIEVMAYGEAEIFRATFLASVDACLLISEACVRYAEELTAEQRLLDDAARQSEESHQ